MISEAEPTSSFARKGWLYGVGEAPDAGGSATKFTGARYLELLPVVIPQVRKFFTAVASAELGCVVFTIAYS